MSEVLDKYNITFVIQRGIKTIDTNNDAIGKYLWGYLMFLYKPFEIADLISDIEKVVSGQDVAFEHDTNLGTVKVYQNNSDFYQIGDELLGLTLPTADLKEILIEWKKFIEKPIE